MRITIWLFVLLALSLTPPLSAGEPWRYEARLSTNAAELRVEAWFPAGVNETFSVDDGAEPFLTDVEMERGGGWIPIEKAGDAWYPETATPLHLRYRFHLDDAAKNLHNTGQISNRNGVIMASPAYWVFRPWRADPSTPMRIRLILPKTFHLVTGLVTTLDADPNETGNTIVDTYDHVDYAPYTAIGNFVVDRFESGGVQVQVATLPNSLKANAADLRTWCAEAIANLRVAYRAFPTSRLVVMVLPSGGRGVVFGSTTGSGGPALSILLARSATAEDLRQDWVLTHECIHLSHPGLPRTHHWFEEGLATYLEPLLRARRGVITPEEVWENFAESMPNGVPKPKDQGLDRTESWGATYWGGALFFLLADVQIREQSGNRKSLDDALRAIVAAGGNHSARWDIKKALDIGDRAVGGHLLRDLHARLGVRRGEVDLPALLKRLGVKELNGKISFDEDAPLAVIRRAMTTK